MFRYICFGLFAFMFFVSCRQNAKPAWDTDSKASIGQSISDQSSKPSENAVARNAPDYVYAIWDYVRENGKAKPGYVGGRTFFNREKRLPLNDVASRKIKYREWDVHPKIEGKNRGAERLVTGSDGSGYYTKDHYRTFTRLNY